MSRKGGIVAVILLLRVAGSVLFSVGDAPFLSDIFADDMGHFVSPFIAVEATTVAGFGGFLADNADAPLLPSPSVFGWQPAVWAASPEGLFLTGTKRRPSKTSSSGSPVNSSSNSFAATSWFLIFSRILA